LGLRGKAFESMSNEVSLQFFPNLFTMQSLLPLVFLPAFIAAAKAPLKASNYFDICHLSEPQFNECVRNSLQKSTLTLKDGIRDLQIPPIDPMFIPRLEMKQGTGNFQLKNILKNMTIFGFSNMNVTDVRFDPKTLKFKVIMKHDFIRFEGEYEMDGQILVLPVKGDGHATYNFTEVTTTNDIQLEKYTKNGKEHLKIKKYQLKIEPSSASSHFTNLFGGNQNLGDATNRFLNDNWRDAFEAYREMPEEAFAALMSELSNKVYSQFSYDELFPQ